MNPASPTGRHPHSARRLTSSLLAIGLAVAALTACASSEPSSQAAASGGQGETRMVTDALGQVEVPVAPVRVVSTDFFSSSVLVDVGITPVATMEGVTEPRSRPQKYIDALEDAAQVSTYAEINVEKVLDLDPDLIIVDAKFPEPETLKRLESIAPLFHVDLQGSWSERALSVADAVNRIDVAEEQKADYDARVAEVSGKYRELLDSTPLAVISLNTSDATWAHYAPGGWPTPTWVDIDAVFRETTEGEAATSDEWAWISDEQLGKLDNAGMILVLETDQLTRWQNNPVWNSLPAVKAGNVFEWWDSPATSSFEWGQYNLDQVEKILDQVKPF